MSDLHLEFDTRAAEKSGRPRREERALAFYRRPPQPKADFLVLAGDIHSGALAVDWVREHFSIPTILVAGNHEAYRHELFHVIAFSRQRASASKNRVIFLERATWEGESAGGRRIRFIGATLWTDFRLYRTPTASRAIAQANLDDFRLIKIERGHKIRALRPSDTARLHDTTVAFLHEELRRTFDGITIVVTHHAPSRGSIAPRFEGDPLNPALASNLDRLIRSYNPSLWIHGHVHDSVDYTVGQTRIICNPRGYFPNELNPQFDPNLVIDVE